MRDDIIRDEYGSFVALTKRETDILSLIASGSSNREIAEVLFIAHSTVRWYIRQIYSKLGVGNRQEAIDLAQKMGVTYSQSDKVLDNLPAQTTRFIGREREIDELIDLLSRPDTRLVTLLAPGGMGKTRLALEAAKLQGLHFVDGIYFIDLTSLTSEIHLITSIAQALELNSRSALTLKHELLDFLRGKQLMLVLDNFEHLLNLASFIQEILQSAIHVKILVTSRERLSINGEKVFPLAGMTYPESPLTADIHEYGATKLFLQIASSIDSTFTIKSRDIVSLLRICQITEGMPLAIVLSANWTDILTVDEICEELEKSIDFLDVELRDLPFRQRNLRAVFEPTWKRLTEEEQTVLMKFSVFRAGCNREAVQFVTGATIHHLQVFVRKALLFRPVEKRYQIHELFRQYLEIKLHESGLEDEIYSDFANYYIGLLIRSENSLKGLGQLKAIRQISIDFQNICLAWNTTIDNKQYELLYLAAESLFWYCVYSGYYEVGYELFYQIEEHTALQELQPSILLKIRHLQIYGSWLRRWYQGNYSEYKVFKDLAEEYKVLANSTNNPLLNIFSLWNLADLKISSGDIATAIPILEECLNYFQQANDMFYVAWILSVLSHCATAETNIDLAVEYGQQALAISESIGDRFGTSSSLCNLIELGISVGDFTLAEKYIDESEDVAFNQHVYMLQIYRSLIAFLRGEFQLLNEEIAQISTDIRLYKLKSLWKLLKGLVACIQGDFEYAKRSCEEALLSATERSQKYLLYWSLSLAASLSGNVKLAIQANQYALQISGDIPNRVVWCLPAAAFIESHKGNFKRATELLSLAFNHSASTTGWIENWSAITQFRQDLEDKLGSEVFNIYWERGRELDLEEVVKQWLHKNDNFEL